MAISFPGSVSNARNTGGGTLTFAHTTTGDDLWVFVGVYNTGTQVSVTFNGVTMLKVLKPFSSASDFFQIFYLPSVAAATANVVVTGGTFLTAGAINIAGAAGIRTMYSATGTSNAPTMTLDTVTGDTVIDMVQQDNANQTYTQGAGQTKLYDQVDATSNQKSAMSYETAAGSSTTMSWSTLNSAQWDIGAISLIPATGGGGGGEHSAVF